MCGIWAILGSEYVPAKHQREFLRIVGRGPDLTVIQRVAPKCWLGFHRLSIVQPGDTPSSQPICGGADGLAVVCNGEIYNHLALKQHSPMDNSLVRNGGSDCAAILHAFLASGHDLRQCCAMLDGVFAFIMADRQFLYVGRDPLGIRPLFYGFAGKSLLFGSELKSIEKLCQRVCFFPPGCCAQIPLHNFSATEPMGIQPYWSVPATIDCAIGILDAQVAIRKLLVDSVEKRLMGNRHFGFMLSGGLDSSLVAALATRRLLANGQSAPIAFSVGFSDSPDLENARTVARFLGIPHRVLVISPQDCIDAIPEVIYAMETFDPLLIRCGIPHFLLCRHIARSTDVKVLLSGEGADELFGSYSYMQRAPSEQFLHQEIVRRLRLLHQYDVLRCDRCTSCHGLEIRVPFLDKKFVSFVSRLPPSFKLIPNKMEKFLLRNAFHDMLPKEVLWRSKEGFSEALGKVDLGDVLEHAANLRITDEQFAKREHLFAVQTPHTKEEFWYRSLFESTFHMNKLDNKLIHTKVYRTAAWQTPNWENNQSDESSSGSGDDECKENNKPGANTQEKPDEKNTVMLNELRKRIRRRSTGSAKLEGSFGMIM